MQNAEQQIAEKRKNFYTRASYGSRGLQENILLGTEESQRWRLGGSLYFLELQRGMACYRELPAEAYQSRFRTAKPADEHRGSVRSAAHR
jgi:hypothetical protein